MSIRFASAASAVALIAGLASPAFAGETVEADAAPVSETEETAVALRAIEPIELDTASSAEDEPEFTIAGSATLASDYRFRGVSQSDEGIAVQGGLPSSTRAGLMSASGARTLQAGAPLAAPIWSSISTRAMPCRSVKARSMSA